MIEEKGRKFDIAYNHLNLPVQVTGSYNGATTNIFYTYTFDGAKLRRRTVDGDVETVTDYVGPFVFETINGQRRLSYILMPEGRLYNTAAYDQNPVWEWQYFLKDHLGNVRLVIRGDDPRTAIVCQENHYYSFGMRMADLGSEHDNPYLYNGKEFQPDLELNWYDYGARYYDASLGRWHTIDRFAEKYLSYNTYQYALNNPIKYIDINGDSTFVYFLDKGQRPLDNGTKGTTYTASVYVIDEGGNVNGPFKGSSYPNSVSNTDNTAAANTIDEGTHNYNNRNGHKGGTMQGLNIDDSDTGSRTTTGITPEGENTQMENVNVHKGTSDEGNAKSRGSLGCLTISPAENDLFLSIFDWSGASGNTGNTLGKVFIIRNTERSSSMSNSFETRKTTQQQNLIVPLKPLPQRIIMSVNK